MIRTHILNRLIIFLPVAILLFFFVLYQTNRTAFENGIAGGEQLIESMQFLLYFGATIFMAIVTVQINPTDKKNKIIAAAFTALFFFIAMEEIAWGQKLFDFETPEKVREINFQGEFTIHNLEIIQTSFMLSLAFILFTSFFTFLPLLFQYIPKLKEYAIFSTPLILVHYFAINLIYNLGTAVLNPITNTENNAGIFKIRDQEIFEFILAIGVFLYAYFVYIAKSKQNFRK